jgi:spermidine/putrescine transport system permease protein
MWIKKYIDKEWLAFFSTPAFLWQVFFVLIPLSSVLCFSFLEHTDTGTWALGLKNYTAMCSSMYLKAIGNSLFFSCITTFFCILIAYPLAYFIAFILTKNKLPILLLLIIPSWTNIITQVYGWFILLQKNGPISSLIYKLHITSQPLHLLNNKPAILLGLVYCFLPFMVLPIYLSLASIDKKLLEASADLGAGTFETFLRVIVPLSRNGLINGILLVCVPAFGEYAAIEILGGANYSLWGGNIVHKYLVSGEYSQGAALTVLGISALIATLALCIVLYRLLAFILSYKPKQHVPVSE